MIFSNHLIKNSSICPFSAWGYGVGFVSAIVFISNVGVFIGPFMQTRIFKRILMFCVALAVGTLGSTGFLVLIPEVCGYRKVLKSIKLDTNLFTYKWSETNEYLPHVKLFPFLLLTSCLGSFRIFMLQSQYCNFGISNF